MLRYVSLCGLVVFISALVAVGAQTALTTVPLNWTDTLAYTTRIELDGNTYTMQLGTYSSDVWVECSRFKSDMCSGRCDHSLPTEKDVLCVSNSMTAMSLTDANMTFPNFSIAIRQNDAPIPLGNHSQGVLGLGIRPVVTKYDGEDLPTDQQMIIKALTSFSLYLTKNEEPNSSYLWINGIDSTFLDARNFTTVVRADHVWTGDLSTSGVWATSIDGIQFGDENPLLVDSSDSQETAAIFAVNTAVLELAPQIFEAFKDLYLPEDLCEVSSNRQIAQFHLCHQEIINILPRLTIKLGSSLFFLDPKDYTHYSSESSSLVVVEVTPRLQDDSHWVLGQPFLRKFPTRYLIADATVDLYCQNNVTCRNLNAAESTDWADYSVYLSSSIHSRFSPWWSLGIIAVVATVVTVLLKKKKMACFNREKQPPMAVPIECMPVVESAIPTAVIIDDEVSVDEDSTAYVVIRPSNNL